MLMSANLTISQGNEKKYYSVKHSFLCAIYSALKNTKSSSKTVYFIFFFLGPIDDPISCP